MKKNKKNNLWKFEQNRTIHSKVMDFQSFDLHPSWAPWIGKISIICDVIHGEVLIRFVHKFIKNGWISYFKWGINTILSGMLAELIWLNYILLEKQNCVYFSGKRGKCEILCTKWMESSPCWQPFCACTLPI